MGLRHEVEVWEGHAGASARHVSPRWADIGGDREGPVSWGVQDDSASAVGGNQCPYTSTAEEKIAGGDQEASLWATRGSNCEARAPGQNKKVSSAILSPPRQASRVPRVAESQPMWRGTSSA